MPALKWRTVVPVSDLRHRCAIVILQLPEAAGFVLAGEAALLVRDVTDQTAHCVLDTNGRVGSRTVLRDGVEYTPVSVLVNLDYHQSPGPLLDAAVLVLDQPIIGPSAAIGDVLPAAGLVTLAGYQPLDTDGSLLRGTRYDNRPPPKGTTGGVVSINTAGCVRPVSDLEITDTQVSTHATHQACNES